MSWKALDDLPWIFVYSDGRRVYGHCQICQETTPGTSDEGLDQFVATHENHQSQSLTHMGLGDAFAAATKALGFEKRCSPCEARRKAMNNAFPKFWSRE